MVVEIGTVGHVFYLSGSSSRHLLHGLRERPSVVVTVSPALTFTVSTLRFS